MDRNLVKESVIDGYGKLAKSTKSGFFSKLIGCCDPGGNAKKVGETIGYSTAQLEQVPENSNLGVGCGNPSALADIQKGETVIDLGSGAGFDAFIVSPIVGETGKVIGVDLSDEMLHLAKTNAQKGNYRNVTFVKGDIEQLPLEDETAAHVISNCVINLSLNKGDVYKEAYRVLTKGGKIAIRDIVLEKELPEFIRNSVAGHIACVSGAENLRDYLQYVENAGFKDIQVVHKTEFPLEVMLADPQLQKLAKEINFNLDTEEAKDIASRVKSISITARK